MFCASFSRTPQAGDRRPQAEIEEAERRLAQDHAGDRQGRRGDQVAHEAGHQVAADDAAGAGAHQLRGDAEILFAQRQQLGAHRPGRPGQSSRPRMTVIPK